MRRWGGVGTAGATLAVGKGLSRSVRHTPAKPALSYCSCTAFTGGAAVHPRHRASYGGGGLAAGGLPGVPVEPAGAAVRGWAGVQAARRLGVRTPFCDYHLQFCTLLL